MIGPLRIQMTNGTLEALKWFALILMTLDHTNKYLFNATLPGLFEAGRLALPIFVFVLAYNLARPGALDGGAYIRTMKRLVVAGTLATLPFAGLGGLAWGWWPLNVLFTLLVIAATLYLLEQGTTVHRAMAGAVAVIGGGLVEYWWPAVVFGIAIWSHCKRPTWVATAFALLAVAALWRINQNGWALAALPLLLAASRVDIPMPRLRYAFYAYYPLHLAILWLIRIPMRKAGYLFF